MPHARCRRGARRARQAGPGCSAPSTGFEMDRKCLGARSVVMASCPPVQRLAEAPSQGRSINPSGRAVTSPLPLQTDIDRRSGAGAKGGERPNYYRCSAKRYCGGPSPSCNDMPETSRRYSPPRWSRWSATVCRPLPSSSLSARASRARSHHHHRPLTPISPPCVCVPWRQLSLPPSACASFLHVHMPTCEPMARREAKLLHSAPVGLNPDSVAAATSSTCHILRAPDWPIPPPRCHAPIRQALAVNTIRNLFLQLSALSLGRDIVCTPQPATPSLSARPLDAASDSVSPNHPGHAQSGGLDSWPRGGDAVEMMLSNALRVHQV
ncbi:hypothetical protein BS50DRAFT_372817 [Corynespora cassiicola Philippines]|uniref:Uncharacterized protein n=1 Tax=Corynespora cassiicola Philippines TaxID=1448308 RepID=A0A2T2NMY9_CORCC|nr:hypothetical protein BS50DRAFT_372817 [Corynespora cassiicola Philippines]